MSEPAPQAPTPPPKAPGMGELFEQSLTALADPSVFRRAAERPTPSFGAAGGLAFASGAAALAVNFAHATVSNPNLFERFPPALLAAVGVAALGLYAGIILLSAVLVYALGNACGGKGTFERGFQAAAMLSVLVPVQMMCNWLPIAWLLPALIGGWAAAGALEGLFVAPAGVSRAACAGLAAAAIGLQFAGRALADRARDAYAATQTVRDSADTAAQLSREMQTVQDQTRVLAASLPGSPAAEASAAPAASGLDLLRGGPDAAPLAAAPGAAPPGQPAVAAAQAMQSNAAGMLDALAPMLATLAASKTSTPEQKADLKEINGLIQDLKAQIASGKATDTNVFAQKMARYQQLLLKVMSDARPPAGPPIAPAANRPPQDGQ